MSKTVNYFNRIKISLDKNLTPVLLNHKILLSLFGLLYLLIVICNHYFFRTFCFDYGVYNFAFYDYAHFRLSDCTLYHIEHANFLQDHVSFTFILFIPFYWLFGWLTGTYTLSIIQVFIILYGGWAVYKLIEFKTAKKLLAILALLQYLAIYGRWTMFDADCNLAIIASSLIPVFLYYFDKEKYIPAGLAFIFILLTREDMALWTFFIGIYLLITYFNSKTGKIASSIVIAISLAYFLFVFKIVIPLLETPYKQYTLFEYSSLGKTPTEALLFMLKNPFQAVKLFFVNTSGNPLYDKTKLEFYFVYFLCGGFLLFYRPRYLLLFIPILAKKMLNDSPLRWSIDTYYSVEFISILPLAVFLIISEIRIKYIRNIILVFVCLSTTFITVYKLGNHRNSSVFWSDFKHAFYKSKMYKSDFDVKKVYEYLKIIPRDAKVSVSESIAPHLAWRKTIYNFPKVKDSDYIVVFSDRGTYPLSQEQFDYELKNYLQSDNWNIKVNNWPLIILKREKNQKIQENRSLTKITKYDCDAETLSPNREFFISGSGTAFAHGNLQSNEYHHGGNFSIKLSPESPYGMNIKLQNVEAGERFSIKVWSFPGNEDSYIVASSGSEGNFYDATTTHDKTDENGWELLKKTFVISNLIVDQEIMIYLWSASNDPVYFDDLEITRERIKVNE